MPLLFQSEITHFTFGAYLSEERISCQNHLVGDGSPDQRGKGGGGFEIVSDGIGQSHTTGEQLVAAAGEPISLGGDGVR